MEWNGWVHKQRKRTENTPSVFLWSFKTRRFMVVFSLSTHYARWTHPISFSYFLQVVKTNYCSSISQSVGCGFSIKTVEKKGGKFSPSPQRMRATNPRCSLAYLKCAENSPQSSDCNADGDVRREIESGHWEIVVASDENRKTTTDVFPE